MRSQLGVRLGGGDVVAAPLPAGEPLVHVLADCWEAGAALLPIDPRLPAPALDALLARALPTVLVDAEGARRLPSGIPADAETAVIIATSGTSGQPRLVELGAGALRAAVTASAERLAVGASDPWLLCVPPAHIGGLLVLLRGLLLGCDVEVHDGFSVDLVSGAGDGRCVSVVPTILRRLVDAGAELRRLRCLLVGGDSLSPALATAARQLGAPLVHTYGQSQSCGGVVYDGVPLPGVTVEISGEGEVLLGGPTLMAGYRADAAATASAFSARGLLRTGDAGELGADGRLRVLGRIDDVIVTGGEKVSPHDVELAVRSHPGVADAAVVGEPDEEWGQRVVAMVVPVDGAAAPTLQELRELVQATLPVHAAPKETVVVDWLPTTAAGKVRRDELRALLARRRTPGGG